MRHLACLAVLFTPMAAIAQGSMTQARFEDDCLQRLRPIVPREVKAQRVGFAALGNNATYYVVTYHFPAELENGQRSATCTYRRDGQWVRDDAAAYKLARELEPRRGARAQ